MDTTITQENLRNILLSFGDELHKKDQPPLDKMVLLGEFATTLIATIAVTIGGDEEESMHAAKLAYEDVQTRIRHIYEGMKQPQH